MASKNDGETRKRPGRMDDEEEGEGLSPSEGLLGNLLSRIHTWIEENRFKSFNLACGMIGFGVIFLVLWGLLLIREWRRPTLEMAVTALDLGAYEEARNFAQSVLLFSKKSEKNKRATAYYVIGVALCRLTDLAWITEEEKTPFYLLAADALSESREIGFPTDRAAEGFFHLGKCYFKTNQFEAAVSALTQALRRNFFDIRIVHWYLANARYLSPQPDLEKALEDIDLFMKTPPFLKEETQDALLLRAQIYLRLHRLNEAVSDFEKIPKNTDKKFTYDLVFGQIQMEEAQTAFDHAAQLENSPRLDISEEDLKRVQEHKENERFMENWNEAEPEEEFLSPEEEEIPKKKPQMPPMNLLKEVVYQQEISDASERHESSEGKPQNDEEEEGEFSKSNIIRYWHQVGKQRYRSAIETFGKVLRNGTDQMNPYRLAFFLIGYCHEKLGEYEKARDYYFTLYRTFPDTAEAVAAEFRWAYLEYLYHDEQSGLEALRHAITDIKKLRYYTDPRNSTAELTDISKKTVSRLVSDGQYAKAELLLKRCSPLMPEEEQARFYATLYELWAKSLQSHLQDAGSVNREPRLRYMEKMFREAGTWYQKLSQHTFTKTEFFDNIWNSAEYYRLGRRFEEAIALYRYYLENHVVLRQIQAHYHIGTMLFEMGQTDEALRELLFCLESYPGESLIPDVRLTTAHVWIEKKEYDKALVLLQENLDGILEPSADVYRNSYFLMGTTCYDSGNYRKTIRIFEETMQLYPEDDRNAFAYYLMALSKQNEWDALKKEELSSPMEQVKNQARRNISQMQGKAVEYLKNSRKLLTQKAETGALSEIDWRLLRNIQLRLGSLLIDMGPAHYEEAELENRHTILRFQNTPDVLQAYIQLIRVLTLQKQMTEAERIKIQAERLFRQFQKDRAFEEEMIYSESGWQELFRNLVPTSDIPSEE